MKSPTLADRENHFGSTRVFSVNVCLQLGFSGLQHHKVHHSSFAADFLENPIKRDRNNEVRHRFPHSVMSAPCIKVR